jgi:hypothetical protein
MVKVMKLPLLFDGFYLCLHPFLDMDPDPDAKPSSFGSGSGKSSGSLRIRIHNTVENVGKLKHCSALEPEQKCLEYGVKTSVAEPVHFCPAPAPAPAPAC